MIIKTLILTVGGSSRPLIIAIENIKPDKVCFIHSKQTMAVVDEIIKNIDFSFKWECMEIDDVESLSKSYEVSKELMQSLSGTDELYINFTGGTKPMVVGLVLACQDFDCQYSYIGSSSISKREKDGKGIVRDGFESFKVQEKIDHE